MKSTTVSTIDRAGRVVIPKAVRDQAGFEPGTPLGIRFRDGRIEIEPEAESVTVVNVGGVAVAYPTGDGPRVSVATVNATRDQLRSERG